MERWLSEHDVIFNGATIPFVLMPHFVSPGQVRRVKHAVNALCRVLDRFCDAYPADARLREELAVPDTEDQLICIEPGYPRPMRICRLDAFLQGYDVKFLEFNADSPAGVGYTDILFEGLRTTIDLERVRQEFDTTYTRMLPELIATQTELVELVGALRRGEDGAGVRVTRGWRRELVGEELAELVAGRRALSVGPDGSLRVSPA